MNVDYDNMFESVVSSLEEAKSKNNRNFVNYDNMLKFVAPKDGENVYLLRILPYAKEGNEGVRKTFHHYIKYFWEDDMGKRHNILSRKTFNEQCPIDKYYWNIRTNGSQYEKDQLKRLKRMEGWYANVLVVNDPVTPANNGTVKVVSFNKPLYQKIETALNGGLDAEWSEQATAANPDGKEINIRVGRMVLDLTDNGINFEVHATKRGQWNNYDDSRFSYKGRKLELTREQQEEILNSCSDVTTIEKEKQPDEIYTEFKECYLNEGVAPTTFQPEPKAKNPFDGDDEIPGLGKIDDDVPSFSSKQSTNTVDEVEAFAKSLNLNSL